MKNIAAWLLASVVTVGCTESLPLEGMPCPCADGYVCCLYTTLCQSPGTPCDPPQGTATSPPVCGASHGAGGNAVDPGSPIETVVEPVSCHGGNADVSRFKYAPGYTPDPVVQANVQALLAQMSVKDKADQMRGTPYGSANLTQMNDIQRSLDTATLRGFRYRNGPRGMNLAEDVEGVRPAAALVDGIPVGYATAFPVPIARGASFDLDLEHAIGEAIGDEMQAAQQTLALAPSMSLLRHPFWGRAQDSYGEDPFHVGRLGSAMAVGIQKHVAAAAKAFMAYDVEMNRSFNNPILDEQTLRETYGRQFRMVVQDAGVASVMASYNLINGIKSTENQHTLAEVLRADFGFKGFVISDWWAMTNSYNVVESHMLRQTAGDGLRAGLDVELPWSLNYSQLEPMAEIENPLAAADLDGPVARILEQKLRFNAHPLTGPVGLGTPQTVYRDHRIYCDSDHIALAEQAALESMVLLKNDRHVLPIAGATKVAVIGAKVPARYSSLSEDRTFTLDFATDANTGDTGTSRVVHDPAKGVGPFAGIKATAPAGVTVVAGNTAGDAADADFVVVVAGLTAGDEGEEYTVGDRASFALDGRQPEPIQDALIASVAALGKPMVVVLEGSSVIDMPWLEQVPAVVMAWYPGMAGGAALGKLLWGQVGGKTYNFSGKLPFTWSPSPGDYGPFEPHVARIIEYYVGYRRFDHYAGLLKPLYPFGHGLSYTSFAYRKLQLGCSDLSQGGVLPVVVNVANTGAVAGDEVVLVFVAFPDTIARRPVKELKGFARVHLEPGEEKQITIPVRLSDLDYFATDMNDANTGRWVVESGNLRILVGGSSTDLPLTAAVRVNGY